MLNSKTKNPHELKSTIMERLCGGSGGWEWVLLDDAGDGKFQNVSG